MTKKIVWRLANRPTPEEVRGLFKEGLLTKDEAREILFNLEDDKERDKKSLESEIKFLRELVERLSASRSTIVETIKYIEKPYQKQPWYEPYQLWCSAGGNLYYASGQNPQTGNTQSLLASYTTATDSGFSGIVTF